jgi:tetratricopeptide (TPR) repeat protein
LDSELDNVRAVLAWTRSSGDASIGLRISAALWRYWTRQGYLREGLEWFHTLVTLPNASTCTPTVRGRALLGAAMLAQRAGETEGVTAMLEESLALGRESSDARLTFSALNSLGVVASARGDEQRAQALFEESLELRRAAGTARDVVVALNNLGSTLLSAGQLDSAQAMIDESMTIEGATSDPWAYSMSLHNRGELARRRGAYEQSVEFFGRSLALRHETRDTMRIVQTLNALGDTMRDFGRADEAYDYYLRALRAYPRLAKPLDTAEKIEQLALLSRRAGAEARADRFATAAASLREEAMNP